MIPLREPDQVMKLERLGAAHLTRLSFMRILLRRIHQEQWHFSKTKWHMNEKGEGYAVYQVKTPSRYYSLIAFSHDLLPEERSDRVIATKWDATFALFDGIPTDDDIKRLENNVPKQEAGRVSQNELCLSRANRSVRLFDYVLNQLAQGQQPEKKQLLEIGYLMRTTAVYGSGKFGLKTRNALRDREEFSIAFQVEMLMVYLIRIFSIDIVEYLAQKKSNEAVLLSTDLKTLLGIGNATGLGMAPFLINHPMLLHHWIYSKETALQRVRNMHEITSKTKQALRNLVDRAIIYINNWNTESEFYINEIKQLKKDLQLLKNKVHKTEEKAHTQNYLNELYLWCDQHLSIEAQELFVSLLLELYPNKVDPLATNLQCDEDSFRFDAADTLLDLVSWAKNLTNWAKIERYQKTEQTHHFWYISADKLEPRLGSRQDYDSVEEYELPIAIGKAIALFLEHAQTYDYDANTRLAEYLQRFPSDRLALYRLQLLKKFPYAEVRDNLIEKDVLAIRLLRLKLSYFGAVHFDPRSDKWLRIIMYQNAPFPDQLDQNTFDDWFFPAQ